MRLLLALLLIANIVLFAVMQWGKELTVDVDAFSAQAPLNADKIILASQVVATASAVAMPAVPVPHSGVPELPAAPASILTPELATTPKPKATCMEWGEFSGNGLAQAQFALQELKLGEQLSQRSVEHIGGFWVYIPPQKNHEEVLRKIEQLKRLGINDYYVVQEGGTWLHTISLGVFRTEEAAQKFLQILRGQGVRSAKVGERKSKLKFSVFLLKELDVTTAAKVTALQHDFPESELKTVDCN